MTGDGRLKAQNHPCDPHDVMRLAGGGGWRGSSRDTTTSCFPSLRYKWRRPVTHNIISSSFNHHGNVNNYQPSSLK